MNDVTIRPNRFASASIGPHPGVAPPRPPTSPPPNRPLTLSFTHFLTEFRTSPPRPPIQSGRFGFGSLSMIHDAPCCSSLPSAPVILPNRPPRKPPPPPMNFL